MCYFFLLSTKKNLVLYKQRRLVIKSTCTGFKTKTLKYDTSFMFFFFLFLEFIRNTLHTRSSGRINVFYNTSRTTGSFHCQRIPFVLRVLFTSFLSQQIRSDFSHLQLQGGFKSEHVYLTKAIMLCIFLLIKTRSVSNRKHISGCFFGLVDSFISFFSI